MQDGLLRRHRIPCSAIAGDRPPLGWLGNASYMQRILYFVRRFSLRPLLIVYDSNYPSFNALALLRIINSNSTAFYTRALIANVRSHALLERNPPACRTRTSRPCTGNLLTSNIIVELPNENERTLNQHTATPHVKEQIERVNVWSD